MKASHQRNGSYPGSKSMRVANLMVGVVESGKITKQDKDGGFWEKGMDGYALSGMIQYELTAFSADDFLIDCRW